MAVKDFTLAEFKALVKGVFDRMSNIPSGAAISDSDIDNSYDWATAQLGFEIPSSGDEQKRSKYIWLDNRMKCYIYELLILTYAQVADIQKEKARQIWNGFKMIKKELNKEFNENFVTELSGPLSRSSGFFYDEFGTDKSYEQLEPIDRESGTVKGIDD